MEEERRLQIENINPAGMSVEEIERVIEGWSEYERSLYLAKQVFASTQLGNAQKRQEFIVTNYYGLLRALGHDADWINSDGSPGVKLTFQEMIKYHEMYWMHFMENAGRDIVAQQLWKFILPRIMNVSEKMYQETMNPARADDQYKASRELRGYIAEMAKLGGLYAEEKSADVGGHKTKSVKISDIHKARKAALRALEARNKDD